MAEDRLGVILLDLDNTLIDRQGAFARWLSDLLARHGVDPRSAEGQASMAEILRVDDGGRCDRKVFCRWVVASHPQIAGSEEDLWREHLRISEFVEPAGDVREMLSRLSGRFRLRLVSNGSGSNQRRKLASAGLESCFESVWISGEQGCRKPSAELFLRALGADPASSAAMVGDDLARDIHPARNLGLATVLVDPGCTQKQTLPDACIAHVLELEGILT